MTRFVDLDKVSVGADVLRWVPASAAHAYRIVPVGFTHETLTLATDEPPTMDTLDDLRSMLDCQVNITTVPTASLDRALVRHYGHTDDPDDALDLLDDLPTGATEQPHKPLGQILKQMGRVRESQIQEALANQRLYGGKIGAILVNLEVVTDEDVLVALGMQDGMEFIDLDVMDIAPDLIASIVPHIAREHRIVPVRREGDTLTVAMANTMDYTSLDDLAFITGCSIRGAVAYASAVARALDRYYPDGGLGRG